LSHRFASDFPLRSLFGLLFLQRDVSLSDPLRLSLCIFDRLPADGKARSVSSFYSASFFFFCLIIFPRVSSSSLPYPADDIVSVLFSLTASPRPYLVTRFDRTMPLFCFSGPAVDRSGSFLPRLLNRLFGFFRCTSFFTSAPSPFLCKCVFFHCFFFVCLPVVFFFLHWNSPILHEIVLRFASSSVLLPPMQVQFESFSFCFPSSGF